MVAPVPNDPDDVLRRIAEAGRGVRFGRGVVGKTSRAMLGVLAVWSVVLGRIGPDLRVDAAMIVAALVVTGVFVWWTRATQRFAERNPAQALLEGAEFLEYQKFEAAVKGGADAALFEAQGEIKKIGLSK